MSSTHIEYKVYFKRRGSNEIEVKSQFFHGEGKELMAIKKTKDWARGQGLKIEIVDDPKKG